MAKEQNCMAINVCSRIVGLKLGNVRSMGSPESIGVIVFHIQIQDVSLWFSTTHVLPCCLYAVVSKGYYVQLYGAFKSW